MLYLLNAGEQQSRYRFIDNYMFERNERPNSAPVSMTFSFFLISFFLYLVSEVFLVRNNEQTRSK